MSRKKEAALTGVLYYLLEEERELIEADTVITSRPGIPAWSLSGRNLSSGLRRIIQSRNFRPPSGCRVHESGMRGRGPGFSRAQKTVELRIRLTGYTAGRRNFSSRNKWNSGS
ncbi:MAG: hypothetical protein ABIJ42_07880 [Acidobacteriota bacterium]